jgi:hypothetical protein
MAVALLALFVALGGTGYAVTKINGKVLKDRSVPAKKLKKDQLTGTEINESKLGKVPVAAQADHAAAADTATNAANANAAATATEATHAAKADTATDANRLGGVPSLVVNAANSASVASCDPDINDLFVHTCATVNLALQQTSHVLVIATGNWYGTTGAEGSCELEGGQSVDLGQSGAPHNSAANAASFALTQLYLNEPSGSNSFKVDCTEAAGDIKISNLKVVAVRLAAAALLP